MLMSSRSVKVVTRLLAPKRVGQDGRAGRQGRRGRRGRQPVSYSHDKTLICAEALAVMAK
jgi:hypothetical protein